MSLSQLAIRLSDIAPRAATPFVRLWARRYVNRPSEQHWLLRHLRSQLQVRIHTIRSLPTGQRIVVDPFDSVGAEICQNGCYEPETVELLRTILGPGDVYVDVGAYIGHHVLISSWCVGAGGAVHAFEAHPRTYEVLSRNIELNRCSNVVLNNTAVGETAGTADFFLADISEAGANSLGKTVHVSDRKTLVVNVLSLDSYFASKPVSHIELMKIDVEGAELLVLRGAAQVLKRHRPILILEYSQHTTAFSYTLDALSHELSAQQYKLYRVGPMPLRPGWEPQRNEIFYNVLAVPEGRVDEMRAKKVIV